MEKFTKYERARILGARGLQIAMDAPLLVKLSKEDLEKIKQDPIEIARIELESDVLPITIKRPFPKKIEKKLVRERKEEIKKEKEKIEEEKKEEEAEKREEAEVTEEGEIMKIVQPEDEVEESAGESEEGIE